MTEQVSKIVEYGFIAQTCLILALSLALSFFNIRYYLLRKVMHLHFREFHLFMFAIMQTAFTFLAVSQCFVFGYWTPFVTRDEFKEPLYRGFAVLYLVYFTADNFSHSIFSFKYFSLARKLEQLYAKQNAVEDNFAKIAFGVQSAMILSIIAIGMWG